MRIIYAIFLPVSFFMVIIWWYVRYYIKLFNTILTRAGITLIIVAFSNNHIYLIGWLSVLFWCFSTDCLQESTSSWANLMSMFSLQVWFSKCGSRVMRKPHARSATKSQRSGRSAATLRGWVCGIAGKKDSRVRGSSARTQTITPGRRRKKSWKSNIGQTIGTVADTKRQNSRHSGFEEQLRLPTNTDAVYQGKSNKEECQLYWYFSNRSGQSQWTQGMEQRQNHCEIALKWNRSNRKNNTIFCSWKTDYKTNNIMMNNLSKQSNIQTIWGISTGQTEPQQLVRFFQVQSGAWAIPFKKNRSKNQQLQPLQQINYNVQSQRRPSTVPVPLKYKEVDRQSKPPPLKKSVETMKLKTLVVGSF